MQEFMGGPGDKMRIAQTFPIFVYFSAKTDPETEVLGHAKTETEFKIPQLPNTSRHSSISKYKRMKIQAYIFTF